MKKILTNKWFLGGLGMLALALLIWFVGDAIAVFDHRPLGSPWARGILIALIALTWAGIEVWHVIRARKANEKMLEQMAGVTDDPSEARSREEVAQLKSHFEQAVGTLKKARFKDKSGAQAYLYQLPWYVFIGAPGSGKTTALTRSGLRFLLADASKAGALKGVGGTRNCDWWFTDEAVFLDTAGRYTTQDSNQKVDSAAWLGFLDLLRKFRPRSPLNGAIVTVSIADLLSLGEEARAEYAATVRQRVTELYEKLGVRFPIYVMVTKCDLVAGFSEMFSDIGQEERGQVWGITFPHKLASVEGFNFASAFGTGFTNLEKRLNARLVDRLQVERDPQRRSMIFGFPQQFSLLSPLVTHFLDQAFQGNRFGQQPLLRGVYFTSGTQEGTPLDRVLGTLSRTLGLERKIIPPLAASGKSFFLTRLLRELVFPEGGLAGFNERRQKMQKWMFYGGFGVVAVLSLMLVIFWGVSYAKNKTLIAETETRLASLQAKAAKLPVAKADDLPVVMETLNEARNMPFGYAEQQRGAPFTMRFGLFQGDKLGEQAIMTYRRLLRDALAARIVLRLEDQLQHSDNTQLLYEALKSYLMLYDDKHMDPEALQAWVVADWAPRLPRVEGKDSGAELAGHVRAALERRPLELSVPMDKELVSTVRRKLATSSLPDRIYMRLKLLGVGEGVPAFNLAEAAGANAIQVLKRASGEPLSAPFPGMFTKDGYQKAFKAQAEKIAGQMASEERWVLGDMAAASTVSQERIFAQVKDRYLEDYVRQWTNLLADIQLKPSQSLSDTILYARILSAPDSPLKKIVAAVARETHLVEKTAADQAAGAAKEAAKSSVVNTATNVVNRILGTSVSAPSVTGQEAVAPEWRVDHQFEAIHDLAGNGTPAQPGQIEGVIAKLADFYQEISAMENALRSGTAQMQGIQSAAKLKAEAERLPPPLAGIIKALVSMSSGQAAAANQANVQAGVQGASAFCERATRGRYPFSRSAQADVTVEDFGAVFAPGGDLDKYFQANLANLVDVSASTWKLKAGGDGAATVTPATLTQFQNADTIRRAFFRGGQAAAAADLVLVSSDAGPVTLDYDGEVQRLNPGQGAIRMKWPAQRPGTVAKLYAGSSVSAVTGEGNWALFRLLDKAQKDAGGGADRVRLSYTLDGKKVVIELRATSVLNPFRLKELENFQCPGRK
ncbi:MAG: type VI secretion system membrane subunit TssM [Rhodocyclaceae bacterium]|nr:type VI secretion system membrane subunit TssM [Rhodocyclaceae bacterium]